MMRCDLCSNVFGPVFPRLRDHVVDEHDIPFRDARAHVVDVPDDEVPLDAELPAETRRFVPADAGERPTPPARGAASGTWDGRAVPAEQVESGVDVVASTVR